MPAQTRYQTMDGVDALDTEWLLEGMPRIPRGDVTLLFGEGESGKGRFTMWMIKQVTEAGGTVIGVWPEDHPNEQIRPRLEAAGLTKEEMSRVINLTRLPGSGRFKISADITHPGDVPLLREEILPALATEGHDVRMLVLDPLAALIGWGSIQTNAGARRAVEPLQDLAMDTGIAVFIIAHTTKAGILQGSGGLRDVCRVIYRLAKDRIDPMVRALSKEKGNNLPAVEDLRFTIESAGNGNARVVILDTATVEAKQRAWRQPSYNAAVSVQRPGTDKREMRPIGSGFTSLEDAQLACSADRDAPGPALTGWHQHDSRTVATSITRADGRVISFAVVRKGGPEVIPGGKTADTEKIGA